MKKIITLALAASIFAVSCKKSLPVSKNATETPKKVDSLEQMITPPNFNYQTAHEVTFKIELFAMDNNPITGAIVKINKVVDGKLVPLYSVITDANGMAQSKFNVPTSIDKVVISANYIGIINNVMVSAANDNVQVKVTGDNVSGSQAYSIFQPTMDAPTIIMQNTALYGNKTDAASKSPVYKYLSAYDGDGVPTTTAKPDVITASMLNYINTSLPETKNVAIHHPQFLNSTNQLNLKITEDSKVWITFIYEGAGYQNALAFYKYPTGKAPQSISDIDSIFITFPNASFPGSGGNLHSGTKVDIGTFKAGTTIGFMCISNGWNGKNVGNGYWKLLTDKELNPAASEALKQQSVMLYDSIDHQCFLGFEDIRRDNSSCDNDFNDIVFYATSNPITAISTQNMPLVDNGKDSDGDGVADAYDAFPNDPSLAYKTFYPSPGAYGTLAFEDLWPSKGDYDFNDLVVGYQYEIWSNAKNQVKEMFCRFPIEAIGAHFSHGFGFQMNTPSNNIASVTGYKMFDNYIKLQGNNTEAGQDNATIIAFDNDYKTMNVALSTYPNTEYGKAYINPDTVTLDIKFSTPIAQTTLGSAPFNPFIIINGDRGKEVHLAGYKPTSLANKSLFGTAQDNTNPGIGTYYKTNKNLPFAINIPDAFMYPLEGKAINFGHLYFVNWAQSGGTLFTDWYKNNSGYRDNSKLYLHK